ncbi:solute carrier family 2, facilitated glucose transporter member 8-like [Planococcus citri]|uniref:solute carrier family 2, facilitated glucose transporter member 8-like n=1 Tax=Planococcus citri TaxID=170843 RepID=UPI0031F82661
MLVKEQPKMNNEKENLLPPKRLPSLQDSISYEQILFFIIIILTALPTGMSSSFSAIALPQLNLNLEETSWFASLPVVGGVLGNLLTSCVIDGYGRKMALFINTLPAFIGFMFLAVAGSHLGVAYLYIGQLCTGISQGAVTYAGNVYISESIAPDNLRFRSSLATCNSLSMCFGLTLTDGWTNFGASFFRLFFVIF